MRYVYCQVLAIGWLSASGCSSGWREGTPATNAPAPAPGELRILANENGFVPHEVVVKRGEPTTLTFVRTTNNTCATKVVFPELHLEKDLPLNTPVSLEIPAGEPRTLAFACGMGMYKSAVVVR